MNTKNKAKIFLILIITVFSINGTMRIERDMAYATELQVKSDEIERIERLEHFYKVYSEDLLDNSDYNYNMEFEILKEIYKIEDDKIVEEQLERFNYIKTSAYENMKIGLKERSRIYNETYDEVYGEEYIKEIKKESFKSMSYHIVLFLFQIVLFILMLKTGKDEKGKSDTI